MDRPYDESTQREYLRQVDQYAPGPDRNAFMQQCAQEWGLALQTVASLTAQWRKAHGEGRRYVSRYMPVQERIERGLYLPNTNGGRCMCGCGQMTQRASYSSASSKTLAGEHKRYVMGHGPRPERAGRKYGIRREVLERNDRIRAEYRDGVGATRRELAERYGVSTERIRQIVTSSDAGRTVRD